MLTATLTKVFIFFDICQVNGRMIRLMVLESIHIPIRLLMKVIGKMINKKATERRNGLMVLVIRVHFRFKRFRKLPQRKETW